MINLPIPPQAQHLLNTLTPTKSGTENLKIGQQIDANIVQVSQDKKNIQLSIENKKIAAFLKNEPPESKQQALPLQSGQAVKLVVIKLQPQPEVKVLVPEQLLQSSKTNNTSVPADINRNAPTLVLQTNLNASQTEAAKTNIPRTDLRIAVHILQSPKNTTHSAILSTLKPQQLLSATVIDSNTKSLKLRLLIPSSSLSSDTDKSTKTQRFLEPKSAVLQSEPPTKATIMQNTIEPLKTHSFITPKPAPALSTATQNTLASSSTIETTKNTTPAIPKTLINIDFPISKSTPLPALSFQQALTLQVIKTEPQVQLQILPQQSPEQTITTAIKNHLPKEIAAPELLNQLIRAFPQIASNEKISETLKRLAQEILRDLPKPQQLTEGTQLKKSLDNSGLYLEAKLAHTKQKTELTFNSDFKAELLKFAQALQHESQVDKNNLASDDQLKNLLKDLQNKSEGALARLMLNQLKSLPQEDQNKQVWVIDLPFTEKKQATAVRIEIEKNHKKTQQTEQKNWSATITLSPPHLDTLHCKVSYFDDAVHTNFWSEDAKTTKLIQDNLGYLTTRFEEEGLTPGNMNAAQQTSSKSQAPSNLDKPALFDDNA